MGKLSDRRRRHGRQPVGGNTTVTSNVTAFGPAGHPYVGLSLQKDAYSGHDCLITQPERASMPPHAPMAEVDARLRDTFGEELGPELDHRNAFELLIATVLSAQTTDVRVNEVTATLFPRWPHASALAGASLDDVTDVVRPLGMGTTRAQRIIGLAQQLCERHEGEVPDDQAALEALPGVGRKTAHVVRGVWFGHSLLAVDTHVARLSHRLGWSEGSTPRAVENDIVALAKPESVDLTGLGLRVILLGRRVCTARSPQCAICPLRDLCPQKGVAA